MKMQQKKEVPDVILKFNKLVLPPSCSKTVNPTKHHACQIGTENINGKIEMLG